jgi:hypothetical protein
MCKPVRLIVVGLFGAPHCGGCDHRAGEARPRCHLTGAGRKRLYVSGDPCPCRQALLTPAEIKA